MIEVRRTVPSDVPKIDPKAIYFDNPHVLSNVLEASKKHMTYTFVGHLGDVIAIVGYKPIHQFAGEFWAVTSDKVSMYPVEFHRTCLELLDLFLETNKIVRVQMVVKSGYYPGIKWAEALGFKLEGILRSYGFDGSDYVMMGRVK